MINEGKRQPRKGARRILTKSRPASPSVTDYFRWQKVYIPPTLSSSKEVKVGSREVKVGVQVPPESKSKSSKANQRRPDNLCGVEFAEGGEEKQKVPSKVGRTPGWCLQ